MWYDPKTKNYQSMKFDEKYGTSYVWRNYKGKYYSENYYNARYDEDTYYTNNKFEELTEWAFKLILLLTVTAIVAVTICFCYCCCKCYHCMFETVKKK